MRKHPFCLGMHLNVLCRFQCCSGTCGLIVSTSKWQKIMMRVSKKELEDWRENGSEGREPKCGHYPMKSMARSMYEREEQRLAKQRNTWPSWETTLSLPSVRCLKPHSLPRILSMYAFSSRTWPTVPKAHAMPTNSK